MDEKVRKTLKAGFPKITDEEIEKIIPGIKKWTSIYTEKMQRYKMVAECYYSKYCAAGIKVGDTFVVYGAVLNKEESTAPVCILAIAPLLDHYISFNERMLLGCEDPNKDRLIETSVCWDRGIEDGGLGHAKFRIRFEKIAQEDFAKARGKNLVLKDRV